jgi:predicted nucleic acid-binding protein
VPFVLDALVTAAWAFEDEDHPNAAAAFSRLTSDHANVPALWRFELGNILVVNERRRRLTQANTLAFLRELAKLPIAVDSTPDELLTFDLARRHHLTFYDAAYLELALRLNVPAATLDEALASAVRAEGLALVGIE